MTRTAGPDGLLLVDKPEGWSSTQALGRCKRLLAARKAGHTGTLDPFATGLLPLAFGEATKFSRFLTDSRKAYRATLRLGMESSSGDTEGILTQARAVAVSAAQVEAALARFRGVTWQVPPMHSAVHHEGRRLYELAREGVEVERAAREVEVSRLEMLRLGQEELVIEVECSKGTYIRTLAADIGQALGCGAYLTALRRTAVGAFRVEEAVTLGALEAAGIEGARARLLPLEVLVASLEKLEPGAQASLRFTQGQEIGVPGLAQGLERAVFGPDGTFLGVGRSPSPGRLAPLRLMATQHAQDP